MGKKLTKIEFIEKSKIIHNDKYDYSLVEYINSKVKVKIICKKHGIFEQTPESHLSGRNCKFCVNNNILSTTEEFIEKCIKKHGNEYCYDEVNYLNNETKVKIICKKHGIFEQTPNSHLKGNGCPTCYGNIKLTTEKFTERANLIHNNKYDYSLVEYINNKTKVKIICKEHGIFIQKPINHIIQNQGCPLCYGNIKLTTEEFINSANEIHNNKYNYSLVEYKNNSTKVKISCKEHGIFEQRPNDHISKKQGCPNCINNKKKTNEEFIDIVNKIHNYKYDYSLVEYINATTKVKIICPIHGIFEQIPSSHLNSHGCPNCCESKGEEKIKSFLNEKNILFETQKSFEDCKNILNLRFDIYLPHYCVCIEFDGEQHFKIVENWGGVKSLNYIQNNDNIKNEYCKKNNIKLYRIRYDENINERMEEILKNIKQ